MSYEYYVSLENDSYKKIVDTIKTTIKSYILEYGYILKEIENGFIVETDTNEEFSEVFQISIDTADVYSIVPAGERYLYICDYNAEDFYKIYKLIEDVLKNSALNYVLDDL